MSQTRVPEWFIGGPLHGKDKLIECPKVTGDEVQTVDFNVPYHPDEETAAIVRTYRRTRFAIGRTELTIWVLAGMDRPDAADRLAEILLAPHLTEAL